MLQQLDHLPSGFATATARELHRVLPGPTLIHLPGEATAPLFVSILLHGNEDVGLHALQAVLAAHAGRALPRALSIFVGNVDAATAGVRRLDHQPDFNRIWTSGLPVTDYEHMAAAVLEIMKERAVFAAVDLHNNSGRNPLYSCFSALDEEHMRLARWFSPIGVLIRPQASLGGAFTPLCPTVTCECGEIGNAQGIAQAASLVQRCLRATPESFTAEAEAAPLDIFQAYAVMKVPASLTLSAAAEDEGDQADIRLPADIESMNFCTLQADRVLATTAAQLAIEPLQVRGFADEPIEGMVLRQGTELRLKQGATAAMLTRDLRAIRQDCLGYLMRRVATPSA